MHGKSVQLLSGNHGDSGQKYLYLSHIAQFTHYTTEPNLHEKRSSMANALKWFLNRNYSMLSMYILCMKLYWLGNKTVNLKTKNKRWNKKKTMKYNDYLHSWLNACSHARLSSSITLMKCASKCSLPWQNNQFNMYAYSNVMLCFSQFIILVSERKRRRRKIVTKPFYWRQLLLAALTFDVLVRNICRFVFSFSIKFFNDFQKKRVHVNIKCDL